VSTPGVPSVLDAIVAAAWKRVEVARGRRSLAALERYLADSGRVGTTGPTNDDPTGKPPGDGRAGSPSPAPAGRVETAAPSFLTALDAPGIRVIAECKRRSPSKGILRPRYDPVEIAGQYAEAGAAAVSVLTEPSFFDGALEHLVAVGAEHPALPLLRKDFTVDEYQIAEAAAAGASAVLLIVAALEQAALVRLLGYAADIRVDVLTEVHDEDEARRAIDAGATIVGVNNRNLKTLAVSIETSYRVAPIIAPARVRVAESGLRSGQDLVALQEAGYGAFLIGERFMTEPNPGEGLARVIGEARTAAVVRP
jgi:indole-3-glycerol phosphate synthase